MLFYKERDASTSRGNRYGIKVKNMKDERDEKWEEFPALPADRLHKGRFT